MNFIFDVSVCVVKLIIVWLLEDRKKNDFTMIGGICSMHFGEYIYFLFFVSKKLLYKLLYKNVVGFYLNCFVFIFV